jgi:formylglycine-generating enzyme required for sulfatase activity
MKKTLISFFTLLLLAAATTATAQEPKPKLAVLVVGMDDWMLGDVLAHLVGEELNRSKSYDVVTRSNAVQNKLKARRRGYDGLEDYHLCAWGSAQGINNLCLVTTSGGNFSLRLLDVSSGLVQCNGSRVEPNAVALKQLAWSLAGNLGSGCAPSGSDYTDPEIGLEMVYVEGGKFVMGCVSGRDNLDGHSCYGNETPLPDSVSVGSFWIGKYEVTQGQWKAVMESTISEMVDGSVHGVGANFPMYSVSWYEAVAFCAELSLRTGKPYRLATEEEWEYAARGGKRSRGYVYSGGNDIDSVAWHSGNSSNTTHAVGTTKTRGNELGIYDMSGNVEEWCYSKHRNSYSSSPSGSSRVIRGGSRSDGAFSCRAAVRSSYFPGHTLSDVGFRVV